MCEAWVRQYSGLHKDRACVRKDRPGIVQGRQIVAWRLGRTHIVIQRRNYKADTMIASLRSRTS